MACAGEVIEPRHRNIVDSESESPLRLIAERNAECRLDGAAMGDNHDITPGMRGVDPLDRTFDAIVEIIKLSPPGAGSSIGANQ